MREKKTELGFASSPSKHRGKVWREYVDHPVSLVSNPLPKAKVLQSARIVRNPSPFAVWADSKSRAE